MYHNKEIINLKYPVMGNQTEAGAERKTPLLFKIRFGELAVGSKFVFNGCWLVKTDEYRAESDEKMGKRYYLFFKKDIVKHEYQGDISHTEKYDLFDYHPDLIKGVQEPVQTRCEIVITPGSDDSHNIDVVEGDYSWSAGLIRDLDPNWSVMIHLEKDILHLVYDNNEIKLLHLDREIWSRQLEGGWSDIDCCTITVSEKFNDFSCAIWFCY